MGETGLFCQRWEKKDLKEAQGMNKTDWIALLL